MRDLKLDANGDVAIESGGGVVVSGRDAIAQRLRVRLRMFRGEWYLDERLGIDYFGQVLVKSPDLQVVASIIRRAILTTEGVIRLTSYAQSLDKGSRRLSVTFSAVTTTGEPLTITEEGLGA
jgi:hypothetical protein